MKIVLIGSRGQLGTAISRESLHDIIYAPSVSEASFDDLRNLILKESPDAVINCAAYTSVVEAERSVGKAFRLNAELPECLALACKESGSYFVTFSTDYVFDGKSPVAYKESDIARPLNSYGLTKLSGERRVLSANPDACIIRTSWLYSANGGFVKTVLSNLSKNAPLCIVDSQIGSPTSADSLARFVNHPVMNKRMSGIYHYSDEGVASWYDFAVAIKRITKSYSCREIIPVHMHDDGVKRPTNSLLSKEKATASTNWSIPHWYDSLERCLSE